jgi:hypothetical protein
MFIINLFTGGSVQHGHLGVFYSQGPRLNFTVNEDITLSRLRNEIYRVLELSEIQFNLKIRVKFNASPPPCVFFTEIELLNNETWRFIVENMGNWKVIELFVDPESKLGTNISQPRLT